MRPRVRGSRRRRGDDVESPRRAGRDFGAAARWTRIFAVIANSSGQRARVKSDPIPKSDLIQPGGPIQSPKSDASGLKLRRGDNGDVPLVNLSTHREADTSERSSSSPMLRRGELLLSCSPMQHRLQPHAP